MYLSRWRVKCFICLCILSLLLFFSVSYFPGGIAAAEPAKSAEQKQLRITRITPGGTNVPAARQIVFQFNRPVVPIGRMDRSADEIPIEITPALQCEWRWINTSALACQLGDGQALRLATDYTITVKPGISAEDGATIAGERRHQISTQRPRVRRANVRTWKSPGTPVIQVIFTQPVSRSSVAEHIYLATEKAVAGRRYALQVEPDEYDRELPRFLPLPGDPYVLNTGDREPEASDDQKTEVNGEEARRVWLITPTEELPGDAHVGLLVKQGLVSAEGPEAGDEQRLIVEFDTFPEFKFVGVTCRTNTNDSILMTEQDEQLPDKCNPLAGVRLTFSSPVINTEVKDKVTLIPDLAGGRKDYDPWANRPSYTRLSRTHKRGWTYDVSLPEALKAVEEYRITASAGATGPIDEFGRSLSAPIDLSFFTDHRLPNYTLVHKTAVLEKSVDSEVPLYVTNLDSFTTQYRTLTTKERETDLSRATDLPAVEDVQYGVSLGIREMLDGRTGAVYGTLSTEPYLGPQPWQNTFFAQVTPYQVHVKIGHFNTLVWVTDLATGKPVKNAKVTIYKDSIAELSDTFEALGKTKTDASGVARLEGTKELDPALATFQWNCGQKNGQWIMGDQCPHLFVRVQKGSNLALIPLDGRFEANPYRASNYTVYPRGLPEFGHIHTWGTTAQGVYRAGDTVQFKVYVRDQDNETYVPAPRGNYKLEIFDPTGKAVHTEEGIELSEFGGYSGNYAVPKTASVGWYQFRLSADFTTFSWQPMRVLISDFTPVPFKVSTSLNGDLFRPDDNVVVESRAALHSGGPYTDAEARITATLTSRTFRSPHPLASSFIFDRQTKPRSVRISRTVEMLSDQGSLSNSFRISSEQAKGVVYGRLSVETAVRDDRGRYVAAGSRADFVGVDRLVGLKNTNWLYQEDEPAIVKYVVVDGRGTPAAGTPVAIKIERLETKAARVKGAGNAYLTQFVDNWVLSGTCEGVSEDSSLACNFTPDKPGTYRLTATINDTDGRPHTSEIQAWVAGKGRVVWRQQNDDALEMVPEQTSYKIGDTARYLLKNPFPGATALISIERYGILKQWVQTLDGSTPVIEFPVEKDFMPGFYLSVIVVSPRVEAPPPKLGEIDLGKPTYKMGYLTVPVEDPYKQLDVSVETGAQVYKPRDTVKVKIHAAPRHRDRKEPIELAVAVLDEAVLDLIQGGTDYFDPYKGFYHLDGLDVLNYSLLTRLVGRQNIEKKGANPGGDGGTALAMRSLFKFVSYWNPSIQVDRKGNAEIEFQVPDNLTGWRVLVMATTPSDRMGLGQGSFKVNRPTEVRPVMPNQVSEGDQFRAGFSVMNRTDQPRDIDVKIRAEGTLSQASAYEETVHLEPYKRTTIHMPLTAGRVAIDRNVSDGQIRFAVTAQDSIDGDGLEHTLVVHKRRSLETAANYASFTGNTATESLLFPEHIHEDVGDVSVVLSPTVIGNIDGAFRYMRDYGYTCWEQKLSKGVMASHYENLASYLPEDLTWDDAPGLPDEILSQAADFQAPNGGMTYFRPQNAYVSPYLSAYTALAFNWLRDRGHDIPEAVEEKLHDYLDNLLKRDLTPSFYSRGMSSTVRAVALAALAKNSKVDLGDLQRYRSHVEYMSMFGKAHYLQAATDIEGSSNIVQEVTEIILQSASQSGGKFSFIEELDDGYSRILATPLRSNCSILSALSRAGSAGIDSDQLGDIPFKLVRSITQSRGNRDHWENTQENMFCMNALVDYSRAFENVPPDMKVAVTMDDELIGNATFTSLRDDAVTLSRPIEAGDPGTHREISINREGDGRLYYSARMSFAPKQEHADRINAGIDIRKEYSVERDGEWILLSNSTEIEQGELVRVDIYLSLPTARNFLVVDDPVPGGLEPVNRDLANTSVVDADKGEFQAAGGSWWFQYSDWRHYGVSRWSFYHKELRHDAARFYSDYLPAGNYHLSYAAQAIAGGSFSAMPVHAEEMYDPDVFGKGLPGTLKVD